MTQEELRKAAQDYAERVLDTRPVSVSVTAHSTPGFPQTVGEHQDPVEWPFLGVRLTITVLPQGT